MRCTWALASVEFVPSPYFRNQLALDGFDHEWPLSGRHAPMPNVSNWAGTRL